MKDNKNVKSFGQFNGNLNISDVISSKKINENNNLLTNEEKIWLKKQLIDFIRWAERCGEDAFYIFDNPKDAVSRFLNGL